MVCFFLALTSAGDTSVEEAAVVKTSILGASGQITVEDKNNVFVIPDEDLHEEHLSEEVVEVENLDAIEVEKVDDGPLLLRPVPAFVQYEYVFHPYVYRHYLNDGYYYY